MFVFVQILYMDLGSQAVSVYHRDKELSMWRLVFANSALYR